MHRKMVAGIVALAASSALAQDPVQTDGDKYRVLLENDCVRVLDYQDQPGEKTEQHRHPPFVLYALSSFKRAITLPDGKVLKREFKQEDVLWSPEQTHVGENIGDTPTHVVIVELKPSGGANAGCAKR